MDSFWSGFEKRAGWKEKLKDFFVNPEFREEGTRAVSNINLAAEKIESAARKGEELFGVGIKKLTEGNLPKILGGSAAALAGTYALSKLLSYPSSKAQYDYYRNQNSLIRLQKDLAMRQGMMSDLDMRERMQKSRGP